jgi:hypothetical protein
MCADTLEPQPLLSQDVQLLKSLKEGGQWLRAMVCTLARRGVLLRTASPERAKAILDALSTLPYYKGGQFLFDLLELEDFMLDGPPPEILPAALNAAALHRVALALHAVKRSLDGEAADAGIMDTVIDTVQVDSGSFIGDLPTLEAGFYLYQDVVLGVWSSVTEQSAGTGR